MTDLALAPPAAPFRPIEAAYRGSPVLAAAAVILALAMLPTVLAGLIDPRLFNGIPIWIKPLKFEASLALHLATVAWALLLLPERVRTGRLVRAIAWTLVAAAAFETLYILWQAARGAGSHYNLATPATRMMYSLMGVGAVALVAGAAIVGGLILRHGRRDDLLVWGAGLGLLLGGVLGGATGAVMSAQPGHWVGGLPSDAGGLPIVGWSRTGGDWRVAHFFGLHLMQALPIVGWLARGLTPRQGRAALYASAAAGTALTLATLWQASRGLPFIPA